MARAAHEVVQEAMSAGVWIFGGGLESQKASIVATDRDGHGRPVPGGHRRGLCRRRALTRGGAEVGCQERRTGACRCAQEVGEFMPNPTVGN